MKKLLIALSLVTAFAAQAANWVRVTDSDSEDVRLFVDIDTFQAGQFDDKTPFIGAVYQYVKDGEPQGPIAYLMHPGSCKAKSGKLIARVFKDGKWETAATHIWSADGVRFYDFVGYSLCAILEAKMEQGEKKATPSKGSI